MTNAPLLKPLYDFSPNQNKIRLFRDENITLTVGKNKYNGSADFVMQFYPQHKLFFVIHSKQFPQSNSFQYLHPNLESHIIFLNCKIKGFCGTYKTIDGVYELDWHPENRPVELGNIHSKQTVYALFHLFNFPNIIPTHNTPVSVCNNHPVLMLTSKDWKVSLHSLPDCMTKQAWDRVLYEGETHLTHIVKLEKNTGSYFSANEVQDSLRLTCQFLTFLAGGQCPPICVVGFNVNNEKLWHSFYSPDIGIRYQSWFPYANASKIQCLFSGFDKLWNKSESWRECLNSVIYGYIYAHTSRNFTGIKSAIILAQTALERLSYQYLVIERKMISSEGMDKIKASDRLRLIFSILCIPTAISPYTPTLQKLATSQKWMDAPHAITDIRNELVHPLKKKIIDDDAIIETWMTCLWFLELSILAVCGYTGKYVDRLMAKDNLPVLTQVPWTNDGHG